MQNVWLVPSVIVALVGVSVQGIKAGWDLFFSIKNHSKSNAALQLQEISSLMNLLEGLPLPPARRAMWKVKLAGIIQRKESVSTIYSEMNVLLQEVTRDSVIESKPSDRA